MFLSRDPKPVTPLLKALSWLSLCLKYAPKSLPRPTAPYLLGLLSYRALLGLQPPGASCSSSNPSSCFLSSSLEFFSCIFAWFPASSLQPPPKCHLPKNLPPVYSPFPRPHPRPLRPFPASRSSPSLPETRCSVAVDTTDPRATRGGVLSLGA